MMTALDAPLKGLKLLTASPCSPVKKPQELASSVPLSSNVLSVNTDFVAFFTHEGCAVTATATSSAIMMV